MYKVAAITDADTADGFNLTPVETYVCDTPEEAVKKLRDMLNDDTIGIIIINEDFFNAVDERTRKKIDRIYRPIVVPVPAKKKLGAAEGRRDYLASLIRLAVGFDIKLGERE